MFTSSFVMWIVSLYLKYTWKILLKIRLKDPKGEGNDRYRWRLALILRYRWHLAIILRYRWRLALIIRYRWLLALILQTFV